MREEEPAAADQRSPVDELLEESWAGRGRPVRGRELKLELAVTAAFLAAVIALVLGPGDTPAPHPAAVGVVLAYALAARVRFPIGSVVFMPTQLFLVPLFVLAPAQLVPALVFAALGLAALGARAARHARLDRIVFCAGDAMYSLGPALVILVLADGDGMNATAAILLLAFAAQLAADLGASSLHELFVMRVKPDVHLRALTQIWSVDAALSTVGLLAAQVALSMPWAALAPLPFVGLLSVMAADRTRKIDAAHDRLQALERERGRLRTAMQRVGEAFASSQDLPAVLRTVTSAAAEALDGAAARAQVLEDGLLTGRIEVRDEPGASAALRIAEADLLAGDAPSAGAHREGRHALAGRVGSRAEPLGVVAVARNRAFSDDERELLAYLCEQATVSAANAHRHEVLQVAEAQMRHRAFHDPLTGLANRALFADRVEHALQRGARGPDTAVVFIDLDGFKLVNDTLGHEAGDELLVTIAGRVLGCPARGGHRGALWRRRVRPPLRGPGGARDRHRDRRAGARGAVRPDRPRQPGVRGPREPRPRPLRGLDRDDVLRRADLAMYEAKRAGGDRTVLFHADMLQGADKRVELAQDLRAATGRGEFELRFQPVLDLTHDTIYAAEALVRWRHPRRGLLGPEEFIAIAEETGTIHEVGRFVLEEACRIAATWPQGRISLNVSGAQLRDGGFAETVRLALRRHGLAADRLMLEVTESVMVAADPSTHANLAELRRTGVALALDDFGTGHSSLSRLGRLPVDVVKLDRSFLAEVDTEPAQARLVAGVVGLLQSLDVELVAEGIERPSQLAHLQNLGVVLGQGYLLAVPMDAEAFAARVGVAHPGAVRPNLRLVS